MASSLFCDSCGAHNRETARFCKACGTPLPAIIEEATTVSTPPPPPSSVPRHLLEALAPEYTVEALIGKGGMGEVYRGRESALDRTVAIKVLPSELASEKATVDRFVREARISAKLQHPNIVPIHAVGTSDGVHYFTMDLIDGDSLTGHVVRHQDAGGLPVDECRRIVADIANALEHAHARGIVHRDLKPSNVMVERGGRVLVMDFGLAKAAESSQLTISGAMLGTPRYMSPEQAEGKPTGPPSDIYSLGLVYFYLFMAEDLVQASSLGAVIGMHLTADLQSKVRKQEHIPEHDRELICRMISRNAADRPAAAAEIARELASAFLGPPASTLETDETEYKPLTPPPTPAPPLPTQPTPTPSTPARKKARKKMEALLGKLDRSSGNRGDDD